MSYQTEGGRREGGKEGCREKREEREEGEGGGRGRRRRRERRRRRREREEEEEGEEEGVPQLLKEHTSALPKLQLCSPHRLVGNIQRAADERNDPHFLVLVLSVLESKLKRRP